MISVRGRSAFLAALGLLLAGCTGYVATRPPTVARGRGESTTATVLRRPTTPSVSESTTRFSAVELRHPASWRAYRARDGGDLPDGDEAYITNVPIDRRCSVTVHHRYSAVRCPRDGDGVHRLGRGQVWIEVSMYYQPRDYEGRVRADLTIDGYHGRIGTGDEAKIDCSELGGVRQVEEVRLAPSSGALQPSEITVAACFGAHARTAMSEFRSVLGTARILHRPDESVVVPRARPCRTNHLRLRQVHGEGVSAVQAILAFAVINRGPRTCRVHGFARLRVEAPSGRTLAFRFRRERIRRTPLFLAAGEHADFQLIIWTCGSQTLPHTEAGRMEVGLPGAGPDFDLTLEHRSLPYCGAGDRIAVEPLSGD